MHPADHRLDIAEIYATSIDLFIMKWYLAKLIYQIICGDGEHTPQFDEQLRLITAGDGEQALDKAVAIGQGEAETFYNRKAQLVQWQFVNVSELHPLNELIDGAELYSRISEADDADAYLTFVHGKAAAIREAHSINCFI